MEKQLEEEFDQKFVGFVEREGNIIRSNTDLVKMIEITEWIDARFVPKSGLQEAIETIKQRSLDPESFDPSRNLDDYLSILEKLIK